MRAVERTVFHLVGRDEWTRAEVNTGDRRESFPHLYGSVTWTPWSP